MKYIQVKNIYKNNLKNFSVKIPLQKLVVIVGPSGSGKSTLVYDVLFKSKEKIVNLPKKVDILEQKVVLPKDSTLSLGEYNFKKLQLKLKELKKNELLIVDEPCAGFCKSERELILRLLKNKIKEGYSIIAVEHTKEVIANADYVIELGPGAGRYGGKLIFEGSIDNFKKSKTITSNFVFGKEEYFKKEVHNGKVVTISKIHKNNLKNFIFSFPTKELVCVTGSSGTGKSTILDVVYRALFKGKGAWKIRLKGVNISGKTLIRRSYFVEQLPISEHSTSTLATYTHVWDNIRDHFSKQSKLSKSEFIITKSILNNTSNFSEKALRVFYNGKNIRDVMEMTIDEALEIFKNDSLIVRKLSFLKEVGLGYLVLGQKSSSLSGGEAQRVRVARILSKKLGDRCVYIFDTPSRGLHLKDIPVMIQVFRKIINKNNTILISDNREELTNLCDYVVKL